MLSNKAQYYIEKMKLTVYPYKE